MCWTWEMLISSMISAPPQRHKIRLKQLKNEQKKLKNQKKFNLFSLTLTHQEIFTRNSRRNTDGYWILHARDKSNRSLLVATWWKLELPKVMKKCNIFIQVKHFAWFLTTGNSGYHQVAKRRDLSLLFLTWNPQYLCVFPLEFQVNISWWVRVRESRLFG